MGCTIKVEVKDHPGMGGVFPLGPGGTVTGGRSGGCDVTLDDKLIAPTHFRIALRHGTPWIENLDPEFGIFVNGEFIEESCALPSEAEVDVGGVVQLSIVAVSQDDSTPAPVPPPPPAPTPEQAAAPPELQAAPPTEPGSQPAPEPAPPPLAEPLAEPIEDPPAPVTEPVTEPTPEPVSEPAPEPTPAPEPESAPAPAPALSPSPKPAPQRRLEPDRPQPAAARVEPTSPAAPPETPAPQPGLKLSAEVRPLAKPFLDEFGPAALDMYSAEQLDGFAERAREMAQENGLPWGDSGPVLFRCMALAGSDLSNPSGPAADIVSTLALVERSAESRLRRVSKIAERLTGRGPIAPVAPNPPASPSAVPFGEAPTRIGTEASEPAAPEPATDMPAPDKPAPVKQAPSEPAAPAPSAATPATPSEPAPAPQAPQASATPSPAVPEAPVPAAAVPDPPAPGSARGAGELPVADRVSFTGYAVDGVLSPAEFSGRDASTGDRVLFALAEGVPAEAHERVLAALPLTHRSIERIENTGVGRVDGADRAFIAVRDRGQTPLSSLLDRTAARALPTLGGDELMSTLGFRPEHLAPELSEAVGASERGYERLVMLWIADLAEALQAAHDAGIVHGGLTPACVVLDARGVASMRWLGRYDASACQRDEINPAVLASLPPERVAAIASGVPTPPAIRPLGDLWSLGVLAVTLLTGKAPFAGRPAEIYTDIITRTIDDPAESAQGVSQAAGRLCLGLMHRDPAGRPPYASAVAEAAREIAAGRGSGTKKMLGFLGRKG